MKIVKAEPLHSKFVFARGTEIQRVEYARNTLKIHINDVNDVRSAAGCVVTFDEPFGFRVLDERDLMEYWPVCSTPEGWLFHILEGGWLDQERQRPDNSMFDANWDVKEYFVTGINECVSVFSDKEPTLGLYVV